MRVLTATLAAAVVLGLAGAAASAQSLGELADKEKQKRQGKPAPKPITENDLARAGKKGTLSMTAAPDAPVDATGQVADAATADAATTAEGTTEGATEGGSEAAPAPPAPEPVKPKGPPPKSEDELRAEAKADVQKKLDAARTNLANHQLVLAQIEQVLNASATYGEVSQGRADLIKRQADEKAAVSKFTDEIAQLEETLRRSAWPR